MDNAEHQAWQERQEHERLHAVEREIERLRETAAEADKLERLLKLFPDLLRNENRWKVVRYYSKSANPQATSFDLGHSCGCCKDAPLLVWPYLETPDGKVYSDPPSFQVGEKHWICGDEAYPGWKDKLRSASIPEAIIEAVSAHFKKDAEDRKEAAEASDYTED